jgi:hypothetical protein
MKSTIFWDITPCSLLSVNRSFGGTYRLHLQSRKNKLNQPPAFTLVSCSGYFFDPEDGSDVFLRKQVAFTLVSCSPYFLDSEDGGDMFLRKQVAFTLVFCLAYFFDPEDGSDVFLRNVH